MLIWFDENNKVTAYNPYLTEEQSQEYLAAGCIWAEVSEMPELPEAEGKEVVYYIDENNSVRAEYEDLPRERLTEEQQAILETAVNVDYLVCLADLGL